jgi:lactobin A/cerein 7B family class IIb bacteriocin
MTDTLVMNPAFGFEELSDDELFMVEGGGIFAAIGAVALKVGGVVGAAIGLTPVGGLILIGAVVVAFAAGAIVASAVRR